MSVNVKAYKKYLLLVSISVVVVTMLSLAKGASWLAAELIQGVPLGNIAVSVSLIALALLNYSYLTKTRLSRWLSIIVIAICAAWYPLGIVWSGNMRLSFTNNGDLWLPFSYSIFGICVTSMLINILLRYAPFENWLNSNSNGT